MDAVYLAEDMLYGRDGGNGVIAKGELDADGSHFTMLFDTSPIQLKQMDEQLNRDPLVIKYVPNFPSQLPLYEIEQALTDRWTLLKKGSKMLVLARPVN